MIIFSLCIILVCLLVLDSIYIGLQMAFFKNLYKKIQGKPLIIKPLGVILCYVFLVFMLYYYIVSKKKSIQDAFILGLCVYAVYNTTSYSLLTDYPIHLIITDSLWGGTLFAITTFIYYKMI